MKNGLGIWDFRALGCRGIIAQNGDIDSQSVSQYFRANQNAERLHGASFTLDCGLDP